MEEANIEESVWQEAVEEDTDNTSGIVNIRNISQTVSQTLQSSVPASEKECINMNSLSGQTAATDKPKMNINNSTQGISAQSGFSDVSVSSIDSAFQRLASTLHEGFNLPKPELLTFNGTPLDYSKFIRNFETNIEGRISDNSLRLSYLIQYCRGEAKCCIEDCVLLDSDEGYKRARAILYSRYGRPHVIARSFIEKLVYGAQIKASDIEGLSKLALEMQKCEITLSQLGFNSDIDNSENLRCIVKRFPMHMRTRWVDIAHSISESGREPSFF
ncbi:thioredoxin domain-containing protein 10 [Mytilus galloprovincialis]|uniref:Thioredoxin domain-containing protein 10 n=1 Tax=Mytilus galloprovincialis TaxID=29158 RepID=A0A8B6H9G0_MYTGA|nr:thioredoxin domain-containing protein 10 [Mytilus galloprovincialis]